MKEKGFTLIEIMVVSIILLILLGIGYDFLIRNTKLLTEEKQKAYIESQVKSFLDFTTSSLQTSFQEEIKIIDENSFEKLIIIVPKENSTLDYSGNGNHIKIYFDSSTKSLIIEKDNIPNQILSGYVENFRIKIEGNFLSINFDVDYKIRNYKRTYSLNYNIRK
ncbi:hypothetical protein ABG79_00248 [Caloramator mitchellensis]|uniref:Prepilin-type N-terminal cleavage/methylation domain-containing protein n=1 Tax=Caloramator mitchellensis TaxID=908809 RepID=A0A0R3JX34_CALMK|nr:prepilin-type N-terminal cleavage/methylation domain-containing protein [Caloramator mitchellensis]KRQ88081.1 hypothetical protein ABG79_00248 [Caloramator mitchellensis]